MQTMKVLVLLSTYNGEKYIHEQLDSILNQSKVDLKLLIRDDGSKDSTLSILNDYANRYPDKIELITGPNIGCRESFFDLMATAADKYPDFDYYAFADQDDVWLDDKIISGTEALDKVCNPFKVYFCRPQLVDANLKEIARKPRAGIRGSLGEAFIISPCIGCSMIFSPDVLKNVARHGDKIPAMHDSLTYKLTLALGGEAIEDTTPHILYRQHASNTIGTVKASKGRLKRWSAAFRAGDRKKSLVARKIKEYYQDSIPEAQLAIIDLLSSYPGSLPKKLKIIFSNQFKSYSNLHNNMFKFAILFNKF